MKLSLKQNGSSLVEFVVIGAFLAIVVLAVVVEQGGVLDNLQEYEERHINAVSAP